MNDVSESLKETIKTRLSNPLWGYIALSWLGFNWQNIATLFMGTQPVNFRIYEITSQDWFYTHYLIAPIVVGFLLAIISPYLQLLITKTHSWAQKRQIEAEKEQAVNKYDLEIALAQKKVEADKAKELALAIETNKITEQNEVGNRAKFDTSQLQDKYNSLNHSINDAENRLNQLYTYHKLWEKRAIEIINVISNYKNMDSTDLKNALLPLVDEQNLDNNLLIEREALIHKTENNK